LRPSPGNDSAAAGLCDGTGSQGERGPQEADGMRSALISIGVATLVAASMAWPQGRTADAPSRVPRGPPPSTTDPHIAGLPRWRRLPPLRAGGLVPHLSLAARLDPGHLHSRPVVQPVVVVPDGRGPAGRPGPRGPLPIPDIRLLDGRPDPVFGLAPAARPRRG